MKHNEHLRRDSFDAVLFDMDGVVTDTAAAHAAAWKKLFDEYMAMRAKREGAVFVPFDADQEYRQYVDGKPRFDGVLSFLRSRGIELPYGSAEDNADDETVCGLGNRKDGYFNDWLRVNRVRAFPGTIEFIAALRAAGIHAAIFSASRNMEAVLTNAGVDTLFDAKVDGRKMSRLGLRGKPDPAMLQLAASELDLPTERCVIVEDAIAGVEAGSRAAFAYVIGVNRGDYANALKRHGADLVVTDLSELRVDAAGLAVKRIQQLGSVWRHQDELEQRLRRHRIALLLDYDGTLTPIVADYRKAFLTDAMRATLESLTADCAVGVISGRDLQDVRNLVGLDAVFYAGSHGFELAGPNGWHHTQDGARKYLPDLDGAEKDLHQALCDIAGHAVERKRFSIAVHYRQVQDHAVSEVRSAVASVLKRYPQLRQSYGKKVFELLPAVQWDKGRAVAHLLEKLHITDTNGIAVYIGDDLTDEAVFRVLRRPNISIVICNGNRPTAADYCLQDCADVQRFLGWLSQVKRGTPI